MAASKLKSLPTQIQKTDKSSQFESDSKLDLSNQTQHLILSTILDQLIPSSILKDLGSTPSRPILFALFTDPTPCNNNEWRI